MDRIGFPPVQPVVRTDEHRRADGAMGRGTEPEHKRFDVVLDGLIQERMDHQSEFEGAIWNRSKSEPPSAHIDLARQQTVDHARRKIEHSDFKLRYALGLIPGVLKK